MTHPIPWTNGNGRREWQPRLPDGRRLWKALVKEPGYRPMVLRQWKRSHQLLGDEVPGRYRYRWQAKLAAYRQLRRERRHEWNEG